MSVTKNAKKESPATAGTRQSAGLGLDSIGDLSGLLDEPPVAAGSAGGPIELPIDQIDEDPNQPRQKDNPGFTEESIAEIGETIKARGVKSPISVRRNLAIPGRYLINHGARRYRGSKWAGRTSIPAFIDDDYNDIDQVIENVQRNDLTPREVADYIGRQLAKGKQKKEIAKDLGKSPSFVTQHVTLLDLPDPIADAFNSGRSGDVTVINELVTAYKKNAKEVQAWLADESQELTRGSVRLLRDYIEEKRNQNDGGAEGQGAGKIDEDGSGASSEGEDDKEKKKDSKEPDPDKLKKSIVQVKHDARPARLLLARRPPAPGWAWLKYEDDGHEFEADLAQVQLVAVIEG